MMKVILLFICMVSAQLVNGLRQPTVRTLIHRRHQQHPRSATGMVMSASTGTGSSAGPPQTAGASSTAASVRPTSPSTPPTSFIECAKQAAVSARFAIEQGEKLLEVDFPPLPLEYLEDSSSSARDISDANTRWAVEFARSLRDLGQVSIIYPDQAELDDGSNFVNIKEDPSAYTNITLATIRADSIKNANSLDQILGSIFGATIGGTVVAVPNTAVYVAIISSTQELNDLEKLHNLDPNIPLVFFNLKLDQLRGDLGLPLFPGRSFHYDFLARIRTVFAVRSRSFATTLRRPPFVLNYSGLLYRAYPEPFQCILNTGNGKNKLVMTLETRPTSAEFRDALISGLQVPGVPKEELKTRATDPWWEQPNDPKEVHKTWRL